MSRRLLDVATENGHCDIVDLLVRDMRANPRFDKPFAFAVFLLCGGLSAHMRGARGSTPDRQNQRSRPPHS
jgi:hypothetical protein